MLNATGLQIDEDTLRGPLTGNRGLWGYLPVLLVCGGGQKNRPEEK